jgi:hypothetical protein
MSTAFYPIGMRTYPASGYNHNSSLFLKQYLPWKGVGIGSNPVGIANGHIRPLTNKDPGNVFQTGFGLPRPIKHYRKGKVVPPAAVEATNLVGKDPYNQNITLDINEAALINYNINRYVKSSKGTSLGGGFGGSGLLNDMQDYPGAFIIKHNQPDEVNGVDQLNKDCKTCEGVGIVSSYMPNPTFIYENPEPNNVNPILCCNQEKKALQRVIYAQTFLNQNYYTTHSQYLKNRCKTFEQKSFNFLSYNSFKDVANGANPYYISLNTNSNTKPGAPLTFANTYLANCQPNAQIYDATEYAMVNQMLTLMLNLQIITQSEVNNFYTLNINSIKGFFNWINQLPSSQKPAALNVFETFINNPYSGMPLSGPSNPAGCQLVVYKPNNYQFAKQGAVSSSTRMLKLNVDTISTNAASINNYNNTGQQLVSANELYAGNANNYANLLKNKPSQTGCIKYPLNFYQSGQFQNKKFCSYPSLPEYRVPISKPLTYRNYLSGLYHRTNHFSQSPNTYNTTSSRLSYEVNQSNLHLANIV